jgi:hypothetical protein
MKQMLDYLMWNSTTHPDGPPDVYSEQELYDNYSGGNYINASELAHGINDVIDDRHQNPPWQYGYWLSPGGHEDIYDALRTICVWIDFPVDYYNEYRQVDVPKPGHPNHVPVAIPLDGNYNHWVSVRGIHTDQNCWPPGDIIEPLTVYGFWINDPEAGGIGTNTYVTVDKLTSDYYFLLNVPGDRYHNKYIAVTDPPHIEGVEEPEVADKEITFAELPSKFTDKEAKLMKQAQKNTKARIFTDTFVINAAFEGAENVLKYSHLADEFSETVVRGKPIYGKNECTVNFANGPTTFIVTIGTNGELREIRIL